WILMLVYLMIDRIVMFFTETVIRGVLAYVVGSSPVAPTILQDAIMASFIFHFLRYGR
ncbi:MAG: hypothetical protein PWR22_1440, partial [Moorella sp. (in: firmicutes)]|nr:hypothetical protein [Moorella sp. (in: firmicutes)]